jgi:hypothetical protein
MFSPARSVRKRQISYARPRRRSPGEGLPDRSGARRDHRAHTYGASIFANSPHVVGTMNNHAVARFKAMRAIIKHEVDGAVQNEIQIDRVGVVGGATRLLAPIE